MIRSGQARAIARQMIRENKGLLASSYGAYYGIIIAASVVTSVFQIVPGLAPLSILWSFGSLFLTIPLMLGMLHVNNMVYYKRSCTVGNLFDFFRNYNVSIKVIGVNFIYSMMLSVVMMPLLLIMMVPVFMSAAMMPNGGDTYASITTLIGAFGVLLIIMILVIMVISMLISSMMMAASFIALRDRSITFGRLLSSSLKIGWKYVWKYFVLQLSFLGWTLLCALPAGICVGIAVVMAAEYQFAVAVPLMIIGVVVTIAASYIVQIYLNAASAAFFNVAIDEYEQQHPDYTSYIPPHVPQAPAGAGFQNPGQAPYIGMPQNPASRPPVPPAEQTPQSGASVQAPTTALPQAPHVEAEVVPPQEILCDVVLLSPGIGKLLVIQVLREITGRSVEEVRAMVETAPGVVCTGLTKDEAREIAKRLTDAGAQVEIQ